MNNGEQSTDGPMTLTQTRQVIVTEGLSGLMQRLEARALAPGHNAVIACDFSDAGSTGPLAGIPIGVKDNIDVAGFATTGGSPALKEYRPGSDAPAVTALREAGAIVACKLNMHELAFGITSDNGCFGRVFNRFDSNRTAGGSSGGSGAAVARGIVPAALGTDTGGSVRIPASFCGVAGFRPSTGRYPGGGVLPLSQTRDTVGVLAATVADICEVDAVLSGSQVPLPDLPDRPLRLGLPADAVPGFCAPVEEAFRAALFDLAAGAIIDLIDLPELGLGAMEAELGFPVALTEAAETWRRLCPDKLGCELAEFVPRLGDPAVREAFHSMLQDDDDLLRRYEAFRHKGRSDLQRRVQACYDRFDIDAMVMPTAVVQPPRWEEAEMMQVKGIERPTFFTVVHNTTLATLIGVPSLSLPAGVDRDGLPVGLMIEGPAGADLSVLAWGTAIEEKLRETRAVPA
ncbi:amidase family protein [Sulfitobacter sp. G21635-S1]|uniref:amidase family protein n=1 Tax=Sulfitobacter sp. G21635-S1 TaxID=3014043 RepID=UPI0022AEF67F|nr:amidase family protein [Sulfitobacter sp. G21635-S1]MCZ4256604.1 amidase family protein [Sulfitobacter sp. G21635-S1]